MNCKWPDLFNQDSSSLTKMLKVLIFNIILHIILVLLNMWHDPYQVLWMVRDGIHFTTKGIRRRIYSCDLLCRKLLFYHIFEQWIFGPNSMNLVITCQNSNFTTSKTLFYYIFSDQSLSMTQNVVKLSFRCGIIWVLTRDH